jgi:uncharacterized protein
MIDNTALFSTFVFSGCLLVEPTVTFAQTNAELPNVVTHATDGTGSVSMESNAERPCKEEPGRAAELFQAIADSDLKRAENALATIDVNTRDCRGRTPLYLAVADDQMLMAELLLQKGADPNIRTTGGDTPLINAVRSSQADLVHLLLKHRAEVNVRTDQGYLLLEAVAESSPRIVETLLGRGANPQVVDENGRTAMMLAIERGYVDVVQSLLAAGADVNAQSADGEHAVGIAFREQRTDLMRLLLARGADPNTATAAGNLLTEAVGSGKADVVKALLDHGARTNVEDEQGRTALSIARNAGNIRIEELLRSAGAKE